MATLFEHDSEGSTDEADVTTGSGFGTPWTTVNKVGACTIKYDSAQAHHGTRSIRITRPTSSDNGDLRYNHSSTMTRMQVRAYVYMTAAPDSRVNLFVLRNSTTFMGYMTIASDGKLELNNTSNSPITPTSKATNVFPLSQWVRVEAVIKAGTTTSTGTLEYAYYLGDSLTAVHSYSSSVQNTGITDPIQCRFGLNGTTAVPGTIWIDDPAVGDGSSGFLGPSGVSPPTLVLSDNLAHVIDASDSTVPSGTISYFITQTAGPTVTPALLASGIWSVTPHVTDTLTYLVEALGSLGGSDSDSVDVPPAGNIPVQRFRRESGVWV